MTLPAGKKEVMEEKETSEGNGPSTRVPCMAPGLHLRRVSK